MTLSESPKIIPKLFQENPGLTPFWMLVGCILMNRSTWRIVGPVHAEIRRRWPSIEALACADALALKKVIWPAGLQRAKAQNIRALARQWRHRAPETNADILTMPGCGRYAADSWAIFVEGRRDIVPTDKRLAEYLGRASPTAVR